VGEYSQLRPDRGGVGVAMWPQVPSASAQVSDTATGAPVWIAAYAAHGSTDR